jgi:hypothetical protein
LIRISLKEAPFSSILLSLSLRNKLCLKLIKHSLWFLETQARRRVLGGGWNLRRRSELVKCESGSKIKVFQELQSVTSKSSLHPEKLGCRDGQSIQLKPSSSFVLCLQDSAKPGAN